MADIPGSRDVTLSRVSFAVIATAVIVIAATVAVAAIPSARSWFVKTPPAKPIYSVGTPLGFDLGEPLHGGARVVVFFRASCPACQRSQDQLKDLAASLDKAVELLLVTTPDAHSSSVAFAQHIGPPAKLVERDLSGLPLRVVPTALVLRRGGTVSYVHEGTVDATAKAAISAAVENLVSGQ